MALASRSADAPPTRSSVPAALPTYDRLDLSPRRLAENALWAVALLLLLALPATLVNSTLEENAEELAAGWRRLRAVLTRWARLPTASAVTRWPGWAGGAVSTVLGVALHALLDPGLEPGRAAAALLLGLALGSGVLTLAAEGAVAAHLWARLRVRSTLRLFPGYCALALGCVLLSRLTGFQPGLVVGVLAGLVLARPLAARELGRAVVVGYGAVLGLTATAYAAWQPVAAAAAGGSPSFPVLVADAALVTVVVAGTQAVAFHLVPLRFLKGPAARAWSARAWLGLWLTGCFVLVTLVVRPAEDVGPWVGREAYLAAVLGSYLALAVGFWGVLRRRAVRRERALAALLADVPPERQPVG